MKEIYFAKNLTNLRKTQKITQAQLAKTLGVDQRTISAWEKGVCEPNFTMLAKICEVFGETFDSILTEF
ncbi:MAG: helix-turn-helix transcriptional regulator [Clostridia bacterium]|nr:helix-turn-helix transcriptional regulator [Clostridia bacterium]